MGFRVYIAVAAGIIASTAWSVRAQPLRGIVWEPPLRLERAIEDLIEMESMGVQAVRSPLLRNETLYRVADSLGLQLYQDFPFDHLPAATLLDTLAYAEQVLQEAIWWAENHTSARDFGLLRHGDTSDAEACRFLEGLARTARRTSIHPFRFYYITSFIENEQCLQSADQVFIDLLDEEAPLQALARWKRIHPDSPVSISALGAWVRDPEEGAQDGYRLAHSPAYQARYLETNLNALLQPDVGIEALFVYRWRDRRLAFPSPGQDLLYPYRLTYGLKTTRNEARSGWAVVEGIYTGDQTVFAFPVGQPARDQVPWVIILGWINVALLGIGFANFPRFRPTVRRYFTGHSFYRDAVKEGRELLFGPNAILLVIVMMAFGITTAAILEAVRSSEAFITLVQWLPESIALTLVALLAKPLILILVMGSGFGLAVTVWTSILSAASTRSRKSLLPGQTFMLVVWPQWPMLIAMTAAVVLGTVTSPRVSMLALLLFAFLTANLVISSIRVLIDFMAIIRANLVQRLIAILGNPFLLLVFFGVYFYFQHEAKISFFWHLVTRG